MQWLQDPNQSNVDNINNVRLETIRHFRNKKEISETYVGVSVTLRRVISLEPIG